MIILGIDPGLATLGWGVIETQNDRHRLIQYGVLTTPAGVALHLRLKSIYAGMNDLLTTYKPDEVAFEELFFTKNVTNGLQVGAARGVALLAVSQRMEDLFEYTPMQVKKAVTGQGKADKHQVQMMVKALLGMSDIARPDDAADALAIAICHAHSQRGKEMFRIQ